MRGIEPSASRGKGKGKEGERMTIEERLEEIAYMNGWISEERLREIARPMAKNQYGKYLLELLDRNHKR